MRQSPAGLRSYCHLLIQTSRRPTDTRHRHFPRVLLAWLGELEPPRGLTAIQVAATADPSNGLFSVTIINQDRFPRVFGTRDGKFGGTHDSAPCPRRSRKLHSLLRSRSERSFELGETSADGGKSRARKGEQECIQESWHLASSNLRRPTKLSGSRYGWVLKPIPAASSWHTT